MQISDVIADMLTRIRNANNAKHDTVDIPASNMKKAIADILLAEGYIKSVQVIEDGKQGGKDRERGHQRFFHVELLPALRQTGFQFLPRGGRAVAVFACRGI